MPFVNNVPMDRYPRRRDHVVWKVLEGKGILLNLETGAYFEVNPVGLAIWEGCDGRTTTTRLASTVAMRFRAPLPKVSRDLSEFLMTLRRRKLVELRPAPSPAVKHPDRRCQV